MINHLFCQSFQIETHLANMSSSTSSQQVWFITGCSQGLGYELSKAFLAAGQKLVASTRNPSKTSEAVTEIENLGGTWIPLDVNSPQLEDQTKAALAVYGRIDVLVNNVGIGMGGAVEDFRSVCPFVAHYL
jgi:NAD(P)-dependent dehydrogenase (short-subunit alcohol dehydrogenase family)